MAETTNNQVTAVVVTYNNSETLPALVASLEDQLGVIKQLVIRDNGSTDGTIEIAQRLARRTPFLTTVTAGANVGFAKGIDAAVEMIQEPGRALLVVNPDIVLSTGIVFRMARILETLDRAGIVSAPLALPTGVPDSASRRRLPRLSSAAIYAAMGRLTPSRIRYNDIPKEEVILAPGSDLKYSKIEATTGALMLIDTRFRNRDTGIFDSDYWMYGEDLQLCLDAQSEGWDVVMLEEAGCLHLKGASSGLPRGRVSDRAFHAAMYLYYRKNLRRHAFESTVVGTGILLRFTLSRMRSLVHRSYHAG